MRERKEKKTLDTFSEKLKKNRSIMGKKKDFLTREKLGAVSFLPVQNINTFFL